MSEVTNLKGKQSCTNCMTRIRQGEEPGRLLDVKIKVFNLFEGLVMRDTLLNRNERQNRETFKSELTKKKCT